MLFVVGSGRCGTHSIQEAFQSMGFESRHEFHQLVSVQLAYQAVTGLGVTKIDAARGVCSVTRDRESTIGVVERILAEQQWAEVEVDYKLSELVHVLAKLYPAAKFLWVRRDRDKVVESMVRRRWYADEERAALPLYYATWAADAAGDARFRIEVNYPGHRTVPYLVSPGGPIDEDAWWAAGPEFRCSWWVDWVSSFLQAFLPADRSRQVWIESTTPDELVELAQWAFPESTPMPIPAVPHHLGDGPGRMTGVALHDPVS